MNELFTVLYALEELDRKIFEIRRQMGDLPIRRKELEDKYNILANEVKLMSEEIENLKTVNKEKEEQNIQFRQKIESDKEYLKTVKSNEEYMMILESRENKENTIKENENKIIENLQRIEDLEKKLENKDTNTLKEIEEELKKINEQLAQDEKEIGILQTEREAFIRKLPEDIAKKYIRIYEKRQGLPIVMIDTAYCTGCFSEIPEQLVDDVRSMNKIKYCTQCGRILLWKRHDNTN